jgi:hypothetical protein
MDPMTMMALAQMAPMLLKAGTGVAQGLGGAGMLATNKRPEYSIPPAMQAALAQSQRMSMMNSPAFEQQLQFNSMAAQTAMQAAQQSNNLSGALALIQAQQQKGVMDATTQNQQFMIGRQDKYNQDLQNYAAYQDQQWQMNEFAPYAQKRQIGEDLIGAGIENFTSSASGIGSGMTALMGDGKQMLNAQAQTALGAGVLGGVLPSGVAAPSQSTGINPAGTQGKMDMQEALMKFLMGE